MRTLCLAGRGESGVSSRNSHSSQRAWVIAERGCLPRGQRDTMAGIALVDAELARHKRQGLGRQALCLPLLAPIYQEYETR
jgi:hypothetical protein